MKILKKLKSLFVILLVFSLLHSITFSIYAAGEGNVDGGGNGSMGEGTHTNQWIPGDEGVRVTVVDAETGSTMFEPIDLSKKSHTNQTIYHFEKECKLTYLCGKKLRKGNGSYISMVPDNPLPVIISSNTYGKSDPQKIKSYFTDNTTLRQIANLLGITFEELVNGQYKLVIEPIIYFTFNGNYYAMTAHEFAMADNMQGGAMRAKFKTTAYKNLAYSMFLEYAELGVGAWTKGIEKTATISEMLQYLGIGIIHFNGNGQPQEPETPTPPSPDDPNHPNGDTSELVTDRLNISSDPYTYRTNTDVITSIEVHANEAITPAAPLTVTFYIDGKSYQVSDVVIPEGESQLVWCKWHTPDEPKNLNAYAHVSGQGTVNIPITIEKLVENVPPDPKATDVRGDWRPVTNLDLPKSYYTNSLSWSKWYAIANLIEYTVEHTYTNEDGEEVTETKTKTRIEYEYHQNHYKAYLNVDFKIVADSYCPTAKNFGKQMGSGYGINTTVECYTSTTGGKSAVTGGQNCVFYFPEFTYKTYWRLGDLTQTGLRTVLEFKNNKYSHFNSRTHFTPLWYPDGQNNYKVYVRVIDAWTPAGMLQVSDTDHMSIKGTVLDDWHVQEVPVD